MASALVSDIALGARLSARRLPHPGVHWLPLALGAMALSLVAYFDLVTNLPFLDEFVYRWTVQGLAAGHGLHLLDGTLAFGLIQVLVALPLALVHLEPRFYRLTVLPFFVMQGVFTGMTARRLGADRFWSALAAVTLMCSPLAMSVATGFMTDIAYLGLLSAAIWFAVAWVTEGRRVGWCILFVALATLQRQQGAAMAPAIGFALYVSRGTPRPARAGAIGLLALWAAVTLAIGVPLAARITTSALANPLLRPHLPRASSEFRVVFGLLPLTGLVLLPFLASLVPEKWQDLRTLATGRGIRVRIADWPAIYGAATICASIGLWLLHKNVFPGHIFYGGGLGYTFIAGDKPKVYPPMLYATVVALASATYALLLASRMRWTSELAAPASVLLICVSITQFIILFASGPADRYYLPAVMPSIPLVAAICAVSSRRSRGWACIVLVGGLAWYAVGQQDYESWQIAVNRAARRVYDSGVPPGQIWAGFEELATSVILPATDASGHYQISLEKSLDLRNDRLELFFAASHDTRAGVTYESAAPGRVVVDAPTGGCALDLGTCVRPER